MDGMSYNSNKIMPRRATNTRGWSKLHRLKGENFDMDYPSRFTIGYVFVARVPNTNRVKIGHAWDPEKRLIQLGAYHGSKLEMFGTWKGTRQLKRRIHEVFETLRLHGEWFEIPDLESRIPKVMEALSCEWVEAPKPVRKSQPVSYGTRRTLFAPAGYELQLHKSGDVYIRRSVGKGKDRKRYHVGAIKKDQVREIKKLSPDLQRAMVLHIAEEYESRKKFETKNAAGPQSSE